MEKSKSKNSRPPLPKDYFYKNEILPDLQARLKATFEGKQRVPETIRDHVGMETINAKSKTGAYFVEFASTSSIHGLNHLVAPNRHPVEKLLAVMFIGGALTCLIILSLLFWGRYQNEATVIVLNNDRDSFKILKPSFLVCPVPSYAKENISAVFEKHKVEDTQESEEFFSFLSNVTYENMDETPYFDRVPSDKWLSIVYDLRKSLPSNLLKQPNVSETWIITEMGVCLAVRSVVAGYAEYEYWMKDNWTVLPEPAEIPYFDYDNDRGDIETISLEQQMKVAMDDPGEIFEYGTMKLIATRIMERAHLTMTEMRTEANVQELTVRQRHCKFPYDGGLKTWPVYSWSMCVIECRMEVIQKKCGCRPHFARPIAGVPVCNALQLHCIGEIKEELFLFNHVPHSCGCIERCNIVLYQTEDHIITEMKAGSPTNLSIYSLVIDIPTITYRRALLYGFSDFMTAVGGAAGLFLGASVLSFVEIFYFLTIHVCSYLIKTRKKRKRPIIRSY